MTAPKWDAAAIEARLKAAERDGRRVRITWHPDCEKVCDLGDDWHLTDGVPCFADEDDLWRVHTYEGASYRFSIGEPMDVDWPGIIAVEPLDEPVPGFDLPDEDPREPHPAPLAAEITAEINCIKTELLRKNAAYGNSATDPVRIFSTASTTEQIRVRIDDKLSRLARGRAAGEDVTLDLIGYLVLLRIAERGGQTDGE